MDLLVESNLASHIENKLNDLCRALDTLSKLSRKASNLSSVVESNRHEQLKRILENASDGLIRLQRAAEADPNRDDREVKTLGQVISRLPSSKRIYPSFERSVLEMFESHKLYDVAVIDNYLKSNPRAGDIDNWAALFSTYRNIVTHDVFFRFEESTHSVRHVVQFTNHLYDVMLRLFFKMLGYEGTYWVALTGRARKRVDWVTDRTDPSELGFE